MQHRDPSLHSLADEDAHGLLQVLFTRRAQHPQIYSQERIRNKEVSSEQNVRAAHVCVCARVCTCTHVAGLLGEEENDAKARQLRAQDVMAD